jgi:hypothetical protein
MIGDFLPWRTVHRQFAKVRNPRDSGIAQCSRSHHAPPSDIHACHSAIILEEPSSVVSDTGRRTQSGEANELSPLESRLCPKSPGGRFPAIDRSLFPASRFQDGMHDLTLQRVRKAPVRYSRAHLHVKNAIGCVH